MRLTGAMPGDDGGYECCVHTEHNYRLDLVIFVLSRGANMSTLVYTLMIQIHIYLVATANVGSRERRGVAVPGRAGIRRIVLQLKIAH